MALETLDYVRHRLGMQTVLGVSNISFGLPAAKKITAAFFTLAMGRGLSAGIVNPGRAAIMDAYRSYCALMGFDDHCAAYVAHYSAAAETPTPRRQPGADAAPGRFEGLSHEAAEETKALLAAGTAPFRSSTAS